MKTKKTWPVLGWSEDGTRFYNSEFTVIRRESDHDEIVDQVVALFRNKVLPGKRLKSGKAAKCSFYPDLELRNFATYKLGIRVFDSHIHDACVKLGIPIYWRSRDCYRHRLVRFQPLVEKTKLID